MKSIDTSLTSPRYVDPGLQTKTLSQAVDLVSFQTRSIGAYLMCEGPIRQIMKNQGQAWNAHYFLHFPTTAFAEA